MKVNCRLCARACSSDNSVPIFSFHRNRLILDLISIFCPIKIERSDNLPQEICEICLKHIENAYELREKSVRVDINLRSANLDLNQSKRLARPATGRKSKENEELIAIKQENPLEIPSVIEFSEMLGETSNYDILDQVEEAEFEDESESDNYKPKKRRKYESKRQIPINKPETSKYEIVNGRYKCPLCPITFSYSNTLPKHIRKIHSEQNAETSAQKSKGSISCDYCEEKFVNLDDQKRHMSKKHSDIPHTNLPKKLKTTKNKSKEASDSDSSMSSISKTDRPSSAVKARKQKLKKTS